MSRANSPGHSRLLATRQGFRPTDNIQDLAGNTRLASFIPFQNEEIDQLGLNEESQRRLLWDNAIRVYGLGGWDQ